MFTSCARWFSIAVKDGTNLCENGSDRVSKQILLFNCMDVRDPEGLFPTLVDTCASSGTHFAKAIFAPSISTYSKVTSSSAITLHTPSRDLTWQFKLQRVWEKIIHGKDHERNIKTKVKQLVVYKDECLVVLWAERHLKMGNAEEMFCMQISKSYSQIFYARSVIRKQNDKSKAIFVACEEDMEEALYAVKLGIWTFWLMNCVMNQELDLEVPQFAESL